MIRQAESENGAVQQDSQRRATPPTSPLAPGGAPELVGDNQPSAPRRIAVYPGSFDPPHRGHVDIARRASHLVDELVIAVNAASAKKEYMFTIEERVALWDEALAEVGVTNARVASFEGLTVQFAREQGAQAIVRGLRAVTDFELEFQQALMNRNMAPEIETIMIITALNQLFVSSSLIKEIARLGGELNGIVTPGVARAMRARLGQEAQQGG
jgi:pantetheine-phosphate adenylyltransferase